MFQTVEIVSILLVTLAMAPALAHLLEFPGKSRLAKDAYLTVQPIYYPGFTIAGGIGEVGGLISVLAILLLTPQGTPAFWLRLVALVAMFCMQLVFWMFTQPVNQFWLQSTTLGSFGNAFFSIESGTHRVHPDDPDGWKKMRDRWEYSHIARAGFASLSFLFLVVAAVTQG
jgi:uncharacterized membrane protein